ncbi:MAG: DUF4147 domain-containing protein [Promethearchaeota archaeon]|nr:MAG: DUF4147 domain-containing protein [Candidatus Lokiarchaeota archaeon]
MSVKNKSQLFPEDLNKSQKFLRDLAIKSLEKALSAVQPKNLIENSIKIRDQKIIIQNDVYNLKDYNKIYIIGGGKATAEMAFTLENILKKFLVPYEGIINIPKGLEIKELEETENIRLNFATHPIPDEAGVYGTNKMLELINKTLKNDLIICLISGGGSALLPLPKKGVSLKDLQDTNSLLLASGASIHEINAVRKHLSDFKGGNLVKLIHNVSRATLIALIISDVVGNDLDSIASGPTVPDLTTFKDAVDVLKKYDIYHKAPKSVINVLEEGIKNKNLENPKSGDPCFKNVHNYLIGSVNLAVQEIISFIEPEFITEYFSEKITGEASEYGKNLYHLITQYVKNIESEKGGKNIALIGSGELTVSIKGKGTGGRNQEMLLSFLDYVQGREFEYNFVIIAANLDGIEGNSNAMGALVDNFTLQEIANKKLNLTKFLENNDSNSFFKIIESEIITGPTGCNVNDIVLILILKGQDL